MQARRARVPQPLQLADTDAGDLSLASSGVLDSPTTAVAPSMLRRASSLNNGTPSTALAFGHSSSSARKRRSTLNRVCELPTTVLEPHLLARTKAVIDSICVTVFDLDTGPEFDNCYPPTNYSRKERSHIAFSCFPDHTEKGDSTTSFSWRIPRLQEDGITPTQELLYGYVYFSQERDPSIRRGYVQRSIAIVTRHEGFGGLFSKMVGILGSLYFRARQGSAASVVEAAINNLYKWPPLEPGTLELPFLGHVLVTEIPLKHQAQFRTPASSSSRYLNNGASSSSISLPSTPQHSLHSHSSVPLLASLPATPLSSLLRETISQLWLIWELVILAEPILVYSPNPGRSSELVHWLVSIIKPLPFAGDYRPFFHIHTPDFAILLNNNKPRAGTLLGATNPLILSAARHYPHILRTSPPKVSDSPVQGVFGSIAKSTASQSFKEAQMTAHGIFSDRKRHIKKDVAGLKAAQERLKAQDFAGADAILLQCMSTLTERFLVPLNRYFATLLPADLSDGMSTPKQTSNFSQAAFLQSLKTHGTPLPFRRSKIPNMGMSAHGDATATPAAVAFYEHFLRSPNFLSWLRQRSEATQNTTRARYLTRLETGDTDAYLKGKTDAQMADLQIRLEKEARLTDDALHTAAAQPMIRGRSFSYDDNASGRTSPFPASTSQIQLAKRSERLKSQVQRVKAIRNNQLESDDSDASSLPSVA